ncbi:PREDICTED: uncharacterized protein LOC106727069 [Myotis brandtii]|uniref:uncharacterized protein LOC106727069 n=1 Tax=Myotis brandtii TaxID=109478 RepID=UPI000704579A|nr:PREDICTED: uncharacterized protein LOC106727069 [Myotis brandtii]
MKHGGQQGAWSSAQHPGPPAAPQLLGQRRSPWIAQLGKGGHTHFQGEETEAQTSPVALPVVLELDRTSCPFLTENSTAAPTQAPRGTERGTGPRPACRRVLRPPGPPPGLGLARGFQNQNDRPAGPTGVPELRPGPPELLAAWRPGPVGRQTGVQGQRVARQELSELRARVAGGDWPAPQRCCCACDVLSAGRCARPSRSFRGNQTQTQEREAGEPGRPSVWEPRWPFPELTSGWGSSIQGTQALTGHLFSVPHSPNDLRPGPIRPSLALSFPRWRIYRDRRRDRQQEPGNGPAGVGPWLSIHL